MAKQIRKTTARKPDGSVSRRTFLQSVIVASAATGAAALPAAAESITAVGATATAGASAFKVLTSDQGQLLAMVLNRLVPAKGRMPGAGDIGIARFVDDAMNDAPHLRQPIFDVLNGVNGAGAAALESGSRLDEVLRRVEQEQKAAFDVLINATYTGYYSDPAVLEAIGWVPPDESATAPEAFNHALLDVVRQRGPIYKNV